MKQFLFAIVLFSCAISATNNEIQEKQIRDIEQCLESAMSFLGCKTDVTITIADMHDISNRSDLGYEQSYNDRIGIPLELVFNGYLNPDNFNGEISLSKNQSLDDNCDNNQMFISNFNEPNCTIFDHIYLNEFEQKQIAADMKTLINLKQHYTDQLNRCWLGSEKKFLQEQIIKIDTLLKSEITQYFVQINKGNTTSVKEVLEVLKKAQIAARRLVAISLRLGHVPEYNPKGLLCNQYDIAYAIAKKRPDHKEFNYEHNQAQDFAEYINQVIFITYQQAPNYFDVLGAKSAWIIIELEKQGLFNEIYQEAEWSRKLVGIIKHFFQELLPRNPFDDPYGFLIKASLFAGVLICNTYIPGSGYLIHGTLQTTGLIHDLCRINASNMDLEMFGTIAAERAAKYISSIIGTKIGTNIVNKIKIGNANPEVPSVINVKCNINIDTDKKIKDFQFLKPLGRGNTGRIIPKNLNEQLAMEEIMANPSKGKLAETSPMNDPRWPASAGWRKMQWNCESTLLKDHMGKPIPHLDPLKNKNINIHFVVQWKDVKIKIENKKPAIESGKIIAIDDFKFKDEK